tara:strand:+ start:2957 stop:3886 length:930 start_codon:yes stop_codon:yes gene_type:complete
MSFIFKLPCRSGGYCNQLWHLIGYYLYSKKNNLEFILDDLVWPWKNNKGWDDYFNSNFKLLRNVSSLKTPVFKNPNWENTGYSRPEINVFTLSEYKNMFKNIMILNESLKNKLNDIMVKFNLEPKKFDSIMIRRGSKMFRESDYIKTEVYLNKLIEKNTKKIFLQTDDYNCYEELKELIKEKKLNIEVITICPESKRGGVTAYKNELNMIKNSLHKAKNKEYIKTFVQNFKKAEDQYNPEEMKIHMEEMIIGLEICLLSKHLSLDLQSNVTRMLFTRYYDKNNVLVCDNSLIPEDNKILKNPAHEFEYI